MNTKLAEKEKPKTDAEITAPRGMHDIWGPDWLYWDKLFKEARKFAEFYDFLKIETPVLEDAALFTRTAGETSDIIEKEIYVLRTKGGEVLALRPEGTAGIARAYAEHKMSRTSPLQKFWYEGAMFRHDRPQAGRFREFHQIGFEIVGGVNDPFYDAQVMLIYWKLLEALRLKKVVLTVNSVGCKICRPIYIRQLTNYYKNHAKDLCADCDRRLKTNPLRLLDCKNERCAELKTDAPNFYDKLCSPCSVHLRSVLEYLDEVKVPYLLDNFLVRGLDYYSRTVFEFSVENEAEGAEPKSVTVAAGGRYDYLFENLGLKLTPSVGCALGMERTIAAMKAQGIVPPAKPEKRVFIVHVGEMAKRKLLVIIEELREAGIQVSEALSRESLQAQLKVAGHDENRLALILGQKEIFEESIIIRDLQHSTQETVSRSKMVEEIKKRLK